MTNVPPWVYDFPALKRKLPNGARLAFLDSAASAQKPNQVLGAMLQTWSGPYANIHRGLYHNSAVTTAAFEAARGTVANFIGGHAEGLVWVRNATEGFNLIANTWGVSNLRAGDVVLLSALEHHANIVPWQLLQRRIGFEIMVLPLGDQGGLDIPDFQSTLAHPRVKLLAMTQMSNALGVRPPVARLIEFAKKAGVTVVVDGSQGVVHEPQNMQALGADFYVFTGHKLYGPTGVGCVWGRKGIWDNLPPYQGGGDMIDRVSWRGTTFAPPPARFEAGTPAIGEVIGLAAACDYLRAQEWEKLLAHERAMAALLEQGLASVDGLVRYGAAGRGNGIVAFNLTGCHHSDVAVILDQCGVAVRSGHHCAMPLMETLGIEGCVRASVGIYTVPQDIEQLVAGLHKARKLLG